MPALDGKSMRNLLGIASDGKRTGTASNAGQQGSHARARPLLSRRSRAAAPPPTATCRPSACIPALDLAATLVTLLELLVNLSDIGDLTPCSSLAVRSVPCGEASAALPPRVPPLKAKASLIVRRPHASVSAPRAELIRRGALLSRISSVCRADWRRGAS